MSYTSEFIRDGKFYTYDEKPIKATAYLAASDLLKNNRKIAIILQGPLLHENDFTLETIKIYQKTFLGCVVIVSTWDNEPNDILQKLAGAGAVVITNSLDAVEYQTNVNWQIFSTRAGLDKAREMGFEWVIKSRCDQRMYETNIPDYLFNLQKAFPLETTENIAKSRIIALSLNTFKYRFHGISDMFQFGHIDDICRYWGGSYITKVEHENAVSSYFMSKSCKTYYTLNPGETKFIVDYLSSTGWTIEYTLESSWRAIAKYFCVIDSSSVGLHWPKYTNKAPRWRNFFGNRQFLEELTFKEWMNLYLGLSNKLYIPEWFVENTEDEAESYAKDISKTILCRGAHLSSFAISSLNLKNYGYENWEIIQTSSMDALLLHENVACLIMDSFAELTDTVCTEQCQQGSLLSLSQLDEYYDSFFAKFANTYVNIPIVFLHVPTNYDDRTLYKTRAIAIKNSIKKMQHKYKFLISLECDIVEKSLDKRLYHFSDKTYEMLAQKIAAVKILPPLSKSNPKPKCPLLKKIVVRLIPFKKKRIAARIKLREKYDL